LKLRIADKVEVLRFDVPRQPASSFARASDNQSLRHDAWRLVVPRRHVCINKVFGENYCGGSNCSHQEKEGATPQHASDIHVR
jgi:hypothetical protein